MKPYKPKKSSQVQPDSGTGNQLALVNGASNSGNTGKDASPAEVQALLSKLLADAKDLNTKKLLLEQMEQLKSSGGQGDKPITADEALKRATSSWKDCSAKHEQAVQQVVKCRENLRKAEEKEQEWALALAKAEYAKKNAIAILAKESGLAEEPVKVEGGGAK